MGTTRPSGAAEDDEHASTLGAATALHERVRAVEEAIHALSDTVTTRRLVVTDGRRDARLVAEVVGGTVELRLEVAAGRPAAHGQASGRTNGRNDMHSAGPPAAVVLHAGDDWVSWAGSAPGEGAGTGAGAIVGLQVWADGDALVELDAWPDADGRWHPHLHLGAPS